MGYYATELDKIDTKEFIKVKFVDSKGNETKVLNLNEECIKEMIARLEEILDNHY